MNEIQLRDAKAKLSSLVDDAEAGEPAVITRRGKPVVVLVGFEEWRRMSTVPSFARLLMAAPIEEDDLPKRSTPRQRRGDP